MENTNLSFDGEVGYISREAMMNIANSVRRMLIEADKSYNIYEIIANLQKVPSVNEFCEGNLINIELNPINIKPYAFHKYSSLINCVPNVKRLKTIGEYSFSECKNLETFGDFSKRNEELSTENLDTWDLETIGVHAFENCKKLNHFNLSKATKLSTIPNACFCNCESLENIELPNSIKEILRWAFKNTSIHTIILPESVKKIGVEAFTQDAPNNGERGLQKLYITKSVTEEDPTICTLDSANAFQNAPFQAEASICFPDQKTLDAYKNATNWSNWSQYMCVAKPE